jgi:LPXTG-motif cell wall-anchored protein
VAIQDAIDAAVNAGGNLHICAGTFSISQTLIVAGANLTISGEGPSKTILDGGGITRIMKIGDANSQVTVTVKLLNFRNGLASGSFSAGGAIYNDQDSTLTIEDSVFINNTSRDYHGGAVAMFKDESRTNSGNNHVGKLIVLRSTFVRNAAGVDGGAVTVVGIVNHPSRISNSTFFDNRADRDGGAVNTSFSDFSVEFSTFLDNKAARGGAVWNTDTRANIMATSSNSSVFQCQTTSDTSANGYPNERITDDNVSTDSSCTEGRADSDEVSFLSLDLKFLAPWGGPTPTIPIGATSSAIDSINSVTCQPKDQLDNSRTGTNTCDAGSYEYLAPVQTLTPASISTTVLKNRNISPTLPLAGAVQTSGQTYRLPIEANNDLPTGIQFSTTTGVVSGTPNEDFPFESFVISGVASNGQPVNAQVTISNCLDTPVNGRYLIADRGDLSMLENGYCGLDATYEQTQDILSVGSFRGIGRGWRLFTGTYDGGGHQIDGLVIDEGRASALFRFARDAEIRNLRIGATVNGLYGSAGLVGSGVNTSIERVSGDVTLTNPSNETDIGCHGGLAGEIYGTSIENSSFTGSIETPDASYVGGLVGCSYEESMVANTNFDGSVEGINDVGGLVGNMWLAEIHNSYAVGTVIGSGTNLGGMVGYQEDDSHAQGDNDTIAVSSSYAAVEFQGTSSVGGLVGYGESTAVEASVWEDGLPGATGIDPIGSLIDSGGTQPSLTAAPNAQMKTRSLFMGLGWEIVEGWSDPSTTSSRWGICEASTRPYLLWQYTASNYPCAPAPANNNTSPGADSNSGGSAGSDSGSSTQSGSATQLTSASNATDSSPTTTTTVAPPSGRSTKASAGRSKVTTTSGDTLPKTGSDVSAFATFALCFGLVGSALVISQRRRKFQHRPY